MSSCLNYGDAGHTGTTKRTTIPTARNRTFSNSERPCSQQRVASELVWWLRVTCDGTLPTPKKFQIVICGNRRTPEVLTSTVFRTFLTFPGVFVGVVGTRIPHGRPKECLSEQNVDKRSLEIISHRKARIAQLYPSSGVA